MTVPDVEYWFDYASPFSYLGARPMEELAERTGARLLWRLWRPMLLGALFKEIGTPDVPLATASPAKQRYLLRDMERWAEWRVGSINHVLPPGADYRTVRVGCQTNGKNEPGELGLALPTLRAVELRGEDRPVRLVLP